MNTHTQQMKGCPQCHQPAPLDAGFCGSCGHLFRTQFANNSASNSSHHPFVAALLAWFGLSAGGAFYNGQPAKAILLGTINVGLWAGCCVVVYQPLLLVQAPVLSPAVANSLSAWALWSILLGSLMFLLGLFAAADAYCVARRIQRGESVRPWQWF